MTLQEIYEIERDKWDRVAGQSVAGLKALPPDENFYTYAERASTMVGVREFLADLRGKRVLEYGCGLGESIVRLAKAGAEVTTFDLSPKSVMVSRARAKLNHVDSCVRPTVAGGEFLPYADESFDIIFGSAILHHLDANLGWSDVKRVLKARGKAVFVEPMGMIPVLNFVRDYVPCPHKKSAAGQLMP